MDRGPRGLQPGAQVAAIIVLERGPGLALAAQPLPSSPLTLAPYMIGLPGDDGREASRFALYSDLVESARLMRLTADITDRPADLADTVERALGLGAPVAAEAPHDTTISADGGALGNVPRQFRSGR